MSKNIHGMKDVDKGVNISQTLAESRTTFSIIYEGLTSANMPIYSRVLGLAMFLVGLAGDMVSLQLGGIMLVVLLLPLNLVSRRRQLPLQHIPKHLANLIKKDPMTGEVPAGEIYCGVDRFTNRQLWLSHREDNMHTGTIGGTGSGKTEYFVSLGWHYLTCGSGLYSVDPKGDVKYPHQVSLMARMLGREHDLTMVSYLTKDARSDDGYPVPRQTNRLNLVNGDWGTEKEILTSLMVDSAGNNASFIENAKILIEVHLRALSMLRDRGAVIPSVKLLGMYVNNLNYLFAYLGKGKPLPEDPVPASVYQTLGDNLNFRESVERFIRAVNGDPSKSWDENEKFEELRRQAGFVLSNTMKVINVFALNFEKIFNNPASDISYIEMLKERRIHLELLPSLTKSRETTKLLGSLATAGMKQAISANLPAKVEGLSADVLNSLPSASRQLFCMIEDEKGAIASEESELLYTQGRSFNIAMKMGTQDIQGGEGRSEGERKVFHQILNNTYLTLGMRIDDPGTTGEFMVKKGHRVYVNTTDGFQFDEDSPSPGTLRKTGSAYREVDIVSSRDLAKQGLGEAHAFCGGNVFRIQTPYMDLDLDRNANFFFNRHVLFKIPSKDHLQQHLTLYTTGRQVFSSIDETQFIQDTKIPEHAFKHVFTRDRLHEKLASVINEDLCLHNALAQFICVQYMCMNNYEVRSDAAMVNANLPADSKQAFSQQAMLQLEMEGSSLEDQGEEDIEPSTGPQSLIVENTPLALHLTIENQKQAMIKDMLASGRTETEFDFSDIDFSEIVADERNHDFFREPGQLALLSILTEGGDAAQDLIDNSDLFNPHRHTPHDPDAPYYDKIKASYRSYELNNIIKQCGDDEARIIASSQIQPPLTDNKKTRRAGRPPKERPEVFARKRFKS